MSSSVQIAATPLMDRLIARTVRMRSPLSVHFDLTYRCNERCVHCYLNHQDHGELTTQECTEILEQLAKAGTLFLTFSGGEIFLRNVRVPAGNLLGRERSGFGYVQQALNRERLFGGYLFGGALMIGAAITAAASLGRSGSGLTSAGVASAVPAPSTAETRSP